MLQAAILQDLPTPICAPVTREEKVTVPFLCHFSPSERLFSRVRGRANQADIQADSRPVTAGLWPVDVTETTAGKGTPASPATASGKDSL